jgi:hypothetical protein
MPDECIAWLAKARTLFANACRSVPIAGYGFNFVALIGQSVTQVIYTMNVGDV